MRAIKLPDETDIILSDTVGFISDLPTELVAAFRATLEEVTAADHILHVRDISHPETEEQSADVEDILGGLGIAEETPVFEVWNKVDALDSETRDVRQNQAAREEATFLTSALTGDGMDALLEAISGALTPVKTVETLALSHSDGRARAWLYEQGVVTDEVDTETGPELQEEGTATQAARDAKL